MNKIIGLAAIVVLTSGCEPNHSVVQSYDNDLKSINGLSDCEAFIVHDETYSDLTVIRCPKSSASIQYKNGKSLRKVIVIDGVEYVPSTGLPAP